MNWNGDRVLSEIDRIAQRRLIAAATFLRDKTKENVSIPAPRRIVRSARGKRYVATTPAIPGAFPRKLSGALRRSITYQVVRPGVVRVGTNIVYGHALERAGHEFITRTFREELPNIRRILASR